MEEIPNLPGFDPAHETESLQPVPQELINKPNIYNEASETPPTTLKETPLTYELDISPGIKATVELESLPEAYFERRHEIKEGLDQPEQATTQQMTSLSQLLADHPSNPSSQQITPKQQFVKRLKALRTGTTRITSLYQQALRLGLMAGLVVAAIFVIISQ